MDEGLSSIQTDMARRDNDLANVKKTISNLVEGLKKVEEEKKAIEAAYEIRRTRELNRSSRERRRKRNE